MELSEFATRLRDEVSTYTHGHRREPAAVLVWFLINVFCLEEDTAVESVCDGPNDKGIDGIWVDDDAEEIYVFQSAFSPNNETAQGDAKLREFAGVRPWFSSEARARQLLSSLANPELKGLLENLEIAEKLASGYAVKLVFVTNKQFDTNATEFLSADPEMDGHDRQRLFERFTYIAEAETANQPQSLTLSPAGAIKYGSVEGSEAVLVSLPAQEILKLDGIQDRTLFARNVRYGVGNTRVNRDIKRTLQQAEEHPLFFLYHNGITVVCDKFSLDEDAATIRLEGYQVINGCQSILSFYQDREVLTEKVVIPAKIIQIEKHSPLIQKITHNANNQNSITVKDLKSNDRVQIALQKQFAEQLGGSVFYRIKRGENTAGCAEIIEIDFAAQLIVAFWLQDPNTCHLKTQMFTDRYVTIFSRTMDCAKIYLAHFIYAVIDNNREILEPTQVRDYALAKFCVLSIMRQIMEEDDLGKRILEEPAAYLTEEKKAILEATILRLLKITAIDLKDYIDKHVVETGFFDYKNVFKNRDFVNDLNLEVMKDHKKNLVRHPGDRLSQIYGEEERSRTS